MKKEAKHLLILSAIILLIVSCICAVSATVERATVSPALSIISNDIEMIKTVRCGGEIRFTSEDFEKLLGCENLDGITVNTLPSKTAGKLMLGSLEVIKNQMISSSNLSALRFVPSGSSEIETSFVFNAGKTEKYSLSCKLFVLEDTNYSPTAANINEKNFSLTTYKNIAAFGNLSASDPEKDTLKFEIVSYPKRGLLTLTDKESGAFVYTPTKNYTGKDSFTYVVTDKYGNSSEEIKMNVKVSRSEYGTVFNDLIGKSCHNSAITLSDLGIMTGKKIVDSNVFNPDGEVSRAEFLTMAMKIANIDVSGIGNEAISVFDDDSKISREHRAYVIAAYNKGIIKGYSEEEKLLFNPNEEISFAEACVILDNLISFNEPTSKPVFSQGTEIPSWAEDAVNTIYGNGIIGTWEALKAPTDVLTRGEAAIILANVIGYHN